MRGLQMIVNFFISLIGIILVGGFPVLLAGLNENELYIGEYWNTVQDIVYAIFHPSELTYVIIGGHKERDLFPYLWDPIVYSLTVLLSSLLFAITLAILFTIVSMLFSEKIRNRIKFFFYVFESLPDILIILSVQLALVFYYKKSGILIFEIASTYEEKAYILPILILAILPTVQLYRVSILLFESESRKDYVLLAKSIGLGKLFILTVHVLRNAIIRVFFQSKKTVWFMLSNLFVIELLFNIPGITRFLLSTFSLNYSRSPFSQSLFLSFYFTL
ncbi:ABC-type dipeptide/oligopeptide/nickel transport system permease component [Bacillus pakistanensis]|uniref:ABC-type dipeptide/oligopeptide/nickel transport system permease component n=1 Tax=Rossellomorea pakistanensis TaxID=992288 RepID=A0ABS2NJF0_9BACI|nr:ABC transporter permease subunit [Bacillus pakistanensis]MBM7587960.1 ABC-type dipeptide/oligopeptide/nickel transport system permease component [Bacillus pakistanensis]